MFIYSEEPVEYALSLRGRHARPIVGHREFGPAAGGDERHRHRRPRVLGRIVDNIRHDAQQVGPIVDHQRFVLMRDADRYPRTAGFIGSIRGCAGHGLLHRLRDERTEIDRLDVSPNRVAFTASQ